MGNWMGRREKEEKCKNKQTKHHIQVREHMSRLWWHRGMNIIGIKSLLQVYNDDSVRFATPASLFP
tara:strand:+ start:16 stop:213 length:198 start_codon:yes stop_codon:yes gene_type:complete